jgi:uncharacterized protein (TIGR00255 family)
MTGFAIGRQPGAGLVEAYAVEIRSVNGKGLAVKIRLPSELATADRAIEERVRARLHRGTVSVQVGVERTSAAIAAAVDGPRFVAAARHLQDLAAEAGLAAPLVGDVLAVPGVVASGAGAALETADAGAEPPPAALLAAVDAALSELCRAREVEGAATLAAMREQLAVVATGLDAVAARAPQVVGEHRAKLIERVNEFLAGRALQLGPDDVIRELGVFADRVDVGEELQRLAAHLERARTVLAAGGQVGRGLEFLFQELLRETNTIGSKSPDVEIAHTVVAMKSAIDRLKEQAANLE